MSKNETPKIEIIKGRWNAERLLWLSMRATDKFLAANDAYTNLDSLMDFAVDLGLVPGHPLQTDSPAHTEAAVRVEG